MQSCDGPSLEGGQVLDAPGDGPVTDGAVDADLGPGFDSAPKPDTVVDSAPKPDTVDSAPKPDTTPVCPATCPIACLPGGSTCPLPSNVSTGQLPANRGSLNIPKGSTWRLCSNTTFELPAGRRDRLHRPARLRGKAELNETTAIGGRTCVFALAGLTIEVGAARGAGTVAVPARGQGDRAGSGGDHRRLGPGPPLRRRGR